MSEMLRRLSQIGIIPVVKLENPADALPLAKALCDGGLACAEITFRTGAAKESIRLITEKLPEMLIGAGTVLTTEQVDEALAAGAKFIVSPGFNPRIVKHCQEKNVTIIPGCSTPSDIEQALEVGIDTVKFFPAEAAGGLKAIKAIAAPYVNVKFMPTGGINTKNLNEYLSFKKIVACGGSWMVNGALIKEGKFDEIAALTRQAVDLMLGFELAHIGINASDDAQAEDIAGAFAGAFGLEQRPNPSSVFAGRLVEVMKGSSKGEKGHIAISTNSVDRAVAYLSTKGCKMNEESAKYDADGNLTFIYLAEEIGGFAVHLIQR